MGLRAFPVLFRTLGPFAPDTASCLHRDWAHSVVRPQPVAFRQRSLHADPSERCRMSFIKVLYQLAAPLLLLIGLLP
jgi:hypothetical protein